MSLPQISTLTNIAENLLDGSRIQTRRFILKLSDVNLAKLVTEIAEQFSEDLNVARCHPDLEIDKENILLWDQNLIAQVLVNLLSNLVKYAPERPSKTSAMKQGHRVILCVEDHGQAIPLEKQSRIFERFERINHVGDLPGLRLVLFVVKRIVGAHSRTNRAKINLAREFDF